LQDTALVVKSTLEISALTHQDAAPLAFGSDMRKTWRRAAIVVRAALLAVCATAAASAQNAPTPAAPPAVPVTTATVTRQNMPVVVLALGTVQPFQSVLVRARVDGTLDQVFFTEGQYVKPGDLLAQLDPRPYQAILDQAVAKKAADEATLANARSDLVRYVDLAGSQVASRQRLDQARAAVGQAEAAVRGDDATIAAAQLNLNFTRITSPIEGRVGLRLTDAGNFIRAADTNSPGIVAITQVRPISLLFTLPQDSLPRVQAAMRKSQLTVIAYSSDNKVKLSEGELLTTDSTIDVNTGTIKLKAVFANADDALWPGQFVNVQLLLDTRSNVPTVPSSAVQRGQDGLYAYVVKPDNTVVRQPIEVDQDDGTLAVVTRGLDGGETVVVAGQSRLTNGTRVAPTSQRQSS
jgi:multidrug efflux system membrane fusion protein